MFLGGSFTLKQKSSQINGICIHLCIHLKRGSHTPSIHFYIHWVFQRGSNRPESGGIRHCVFHVYVFNFYSHKNVFSMEFHKLEKEQVWKMNLDLAIRRIRLVTFIGKPFHGYEKN